MRVGIDITALMYGRGVSRYTTNLVRSLSSQSDLELSLFGWSLRQKKQLQQFSQSLKFQPAATHFLSWPPKLMKYLWQFGLLPVGKLDPQLDVFHSWDYLQPPDTKLPLVSTIHDLAMLKYPATAHPDVLRAHQAAWKILEQRQAHIIAVSYAIKQDILQLLPFPSDQVHVVHSAVPREIKTAAQHLTEEEHEQILQQLTQGRPYILFIGTLEPRKNLARLVEAWKPLQNEVDLLIVGAAGWDTDSLGALPEHAHLLGRQSDTNVSVLYTEAEALVFPSLDEGFGLPILEAYSYGTPVVTSQVGGMAEIAGNAAVLVNPESVESIRQGIEDMLHETSEERQLRLQRMIVRLHSFSWKKTAELTASVYRQAAQERA